MLKFIAESIRNNKNIIEKIEISPIIQYIDKNTFKSARICFDIGEDSAAIKNDDKYILITTDRIKTDFIENFPFGAGFSSILVSVDDIYACGGIPIAATIIISVRDVNTCNNILEGICEASKKFQVPIIRGHTNSRSPSYELSSTMIGEIKKEDYISAGNAQVDDNIILAVDFDGRIAKASKLYFDTTTFKSSEEVIEKRKAMNIIAEKHLANSSKDVSNGGIFGTMLQLTKYSNVGANVNVNKIIIPPVLSELNYTLEMYIKMYLTTSFILTAPNENCNEIINIFKNHGIEANVIGKIIKQKNLKINDSKETIDVIKF
ncbi:MAG: AIR synthase related protein [Candidatus Hodarchaeota archaeon]